MTAPAVTARPGWSIPETARAMKGEFVKRLPVMDELGTLIGIVSRSDLLKIFLRKDDAIRDEIVHEVFGETLWLAPHDVAVDVRDGRGCSGRAPSAQEHGRSRGAPLPLGRRCGGCPSKDRFRR
jgi:hypothetical protein